MLRKILPVVLVLLAFTVSAQTQNSKMNAFVAELMKKMTLDEKIGQLNLLTDGGAYHGIVVNTNVNQDQRR
jgi:beta-glucosidase